MPLNSQKEAKNNPKSVSGNQCLRTVTKHLTKNMPIQIQGKQTAESFYEMLVSLAIHRHSVHSASKLFEKFPSESAIRYHLNKFTMDDLLSQSFTILWESAAACLPPGKAYEFAIDETTDPYYGKRDEKNLDHVISFVRKKSTNHFYGYCTLSVVSKNEKFILGVVPFLTSTSHKEMVQQLVSTLKSHQITPKVLYMDKGFYRSGVISVLRKENIPFIIRLPIHGDKFRKRIWSCKKSTVLHHIMDARLPGGKREKMQISIAVQAYRNKKHDGWLSHKGYVIEGKEVERWPVGKIAKMYEHRFSIEASYRIRNQIKPRTSTKNPVIRYLFTIISFLIENVWVAFQMKHFIPCRRGPKVIDEDRFPLSVFVGLVSFQLKRKWKGVTTVEGLR